MAEVENKNQAAAAQADAAQDTVKSEARKPSQQEPQPRPCPQDCSRCTTPQHVFCSAKMLFDMSRVIQEQRRQQAEIVMAVAEIREQLRQKDQDVQLSLPFGGDN